MATTPASKQSKTKKQQADDEEDAQDQGDDESAEGEDDSNQTDAQKREAAFRDMVNRKRGRKLWPQQKRGPSTGTTITATSASASTT